jgi:hypothetical protein
MRFPSIGLSFVLNCIRSFVRFQKQASSQLLIINLKHTSGNFHWQFYNTFALYTIIDAFMCLIVLLNNGSMLVHSE